MYKNAQRNAQMIEAPNHYGCGSIHLGNITAAFDVKYMTQNNITHAVTALTKDKAKNSVFEDLAIEQKIVPCEDDADFNIFVMLDNVADFIQESIRKGNVFIHCMGGVSRSPTCLIAFYIKYRQMKVVDALKLIQSKRKCVCPNKGFMDQLSQFEAMYLG